MLREVREHVLPYRLELVLEGDGRRSIVVSLRPELPWIGRPAIRWERPRRPPSPFSVACTRSLAGSVLARVDKLGSDRVAVLRFGGPMLVAELATHGANLVLVDGQGRIVATARRPRTGHLRLGIGEAYQPPGVPEAKLDPFGATPERIDAFLSAAVAGGESLFEALRRQLFGVGTAGARLVVQEAAAGGGTAGEILAARLAALARGDLDPVVEAGTEDPVREAERGTLDPPSIELLPWSPPAASAGRFLLQEEDAAGTTGLYHDAMERAGWNAERGNSLLAILRAEIKRLAAAERKVAGNLDGFDDPDRHRLWGEALLAGLTRARRSGEVAIVADPYDPDGREIAVPAPAGTSLTTAAEDHFRRHRRARRGIEECRRRLDALVARRGRLERLLVDSGERVRTVEDGSVLAEGLRKEGIAVGLEPRTRAGREAAAVGRPRLEGVRLFTSSDGRSILVGKTGKDNDRLTFKLASPDDFWLHASGVPGAHVILRNPERETRPPKESLEEAAALAAWYSDSRNSGQAEVEWTKRKHVRRARGAPRGTVTVKRSETVRVRPRCLSGDQDHEAN